MLLPLSYGPFQLVCIRGTGLEPVLRGSQPLVPNHLHHPLVCGAPPARGEWSTARAPEGDEFVSRVSGTSGIRTRDRPVDSRML